MASPFDGSSNGNSRRFSSELVHVAPDVLELRAVPGRGWSEANRRELLAIGQRALGNGIRFELKLVRPEELVRTASGKARPVVGL